MNIYGESGVSSSTLHKELTNGHLITESTTFVIPKNGKYFILASGGGGSGGAGAEDYNNTRGVQGGGSGFTVISEKEYSAGAEITVFIGAGGLAPLVTAQNSSNGEDGGSTTFDDVVALGGEGGNQHYAEIPNHASYKEGKGFVKGGYGNTENPTILKNNLGKLALTGVNARESISISDGNVSAGAGGASFLKKGGNGKLSTLATDKGEDGHLGSGGGGIFSTTGGATNLRSGNGGDGWVYIEHIGE